MGTPPDLRQKKSKKKTKMLTVLLPLALIAIAFADHHKEVDPLHYQVDITSEDSSYNFGVDDDDTDKSDEAGRRAWNRANNVAQMIQNKIEKAHNECDYWPRKDNERCLRAVTACILEPLTLIGELKRHMNLISERCDELNLGNNKGAKAAIKSAKASAKQVVEYVLKQERWAKTFCGSQDDACKDNVECKILADVADIYRDNIELQACDIKREDYETTYPDEPPSPKTRKN